jgi:predicted Zn-dependent protease
MPFQPLVFLVGLALQAPAPAVPTDVVSQAYFLFLEGRDLEGRGDLAGAIAAYQRAIQIAPKAADLHAELAGLYARQGLARESMNEARAALDVDADNREANRILGFVEAAIIDRPIRGLPTPPVADAIDHLSRALRGGLRDPGAELTLGRLYVRNGQYNDGLKTLNSFLVDQPGYPEAVMLVAEAYERTGKLAEAIGALEDLVASAPDQTRASAWLAELYEAAGRWKDAATAWHALATANPAVAAYRSRYATALVNGGDVEAGRRELADLAQQSPRDPAIWYLLSQVERRAGNAAGAEAAAAHITEIDPKDARGPLALAEARAARGDAKGVVDILAPRVATVADEDVQSGVYARMVSALASALFDTHDDARAVTVLEAARLRDPDDQGVLYDLATAYERTGRIDQAELVLRDVVARDGDDADALNSLGYLLADHARKLDEAVQLIKRALATDANNPSFLDSLGWAYFKQGHLDQALDPLERAAAARPASSVIQDHLGDLYFQIKRYRDATGAFDRALSGDRAGLDVTAVTKKRDKARELAGR